MEIETDRDEVTQMFNSYIVRGSVNETWIEDALEFLCGANLASGGDNGDYTIDFRGLVQDVGDGGFQEGTQDFEQIRELASIFISRYCEYQTDNSREEKEQADLERYL